MHFSRNLSGSLVLLLSILLMTYGTCAAAGKGNTKPVTAPEWSALQKVNAAGSRERERPYYGLEIAMDDSGNIIVVWNENSNLSVAEYAGGVWTDTIAIPTDNGMAIRDQHISMSGNGDAIIVWTQASSPSVLEFKMVERKSGVWSAPTLISGSVTGTQSVKIANNGDAIITWVENAGVGTNLQRELFMIERRAGLWGAPANITDGYINGALEIDTAMADNGDTIIAWNAPDDNYSGFFRVYMSEYRNGTWQHPVSGDDYINMPDTSCALPKVAISNNGDAMISWMQRRLDANSGSYIYEIQVSGYRSGAWSALANLYLGFQGIPDINLAMDNGGNAIMSWYSTSTASGNPAVYAFECRSGVCGLVSEGAELSPNSTALHGSYNPSVGIDDNGNAVIFWTESTIDRTATYKSEYRGGVWHHPSPNDYQASIYNTFAEGIAMSNAGTAAAIMTASRDVERWGTTTSYGRGLYISQYK